GRGAVFTHEGRNELDAAVMDGATLRAGAVAGVRGIRNPVLMARAAMEHSPHVMLIGEGAEALAHERGIAFAAPEYFRTEERWRELQNALANQARDEPQDYFGTVGAVALDVRGHLAAATSTGGMTNKRWGRVGDAPIIGAGTYANARCAVSCTGHGEFYIRTCAAHAICMRVAEMHQLVADASKQVIDREIPQLGGSGGAIVLCADGSFALPFNTEGMYRGWIDGEGQPHTRIWQDEGSLRRLQQRRDDPLQPLASPYRILVFPAVVREIAFAIDRKVHRQVPDAPVSGNVRIAEQACRKTQTFGDRAYLVQLVGRVQAETQHHQSITRVLLRVARQQRQFLAAGRAPGCPESEDHHLAAQIARVDVASVERRQRDRRCRRADYQIVARPRGLRQRKQHQ